MKNKEPHIRRIGLLTPYTGGNIGDGAIQEAVIANIRARYHDVCIYGFTLNPGATEKLHEIPCFPLTALTIKHYCAAQSSKISVPVSRKESNAGSLQRVKDIIKIVPPLFSMLKSIHQGSRALSCIPAELQLIKRSYEMLKEFDLLIVSGGGQIDDYWGGPWGHPYSLLKWGLIARATRTPYVFLSVGTCELESPLSALFVKWALKLAAYRSYRDEKSKTLLKQMTFTRDDPVCPDLALSHELSLKERSLPNEEHRPVVGISPIAYLSPHSWPRRDLDTYNRYIAALTAFVSSLLQEGYSVILFHTDSPDKFVIRELRDALQKEMTADSVGSIGEASIETVDDLLSLMAKVDYVVASRLHGVILAHLMNRPVLAVSYDRKVTTYMEDTEQANYCLDIHNFDLDSLTKTFGALRSNEEVIQSLIAGKTAQFRRDLTGQYDDILNTHCEGSVTQDYTRSKRIP